MYAQACHSYQLSLFLKKVINIISYVEEIPWWSPILVPVNSYFWDFFFILGFSFGRG